jgi:hypothetical protein
MTVEMMLLVAELYVADIWLVPAISPTLNAILCHFNTRFVALQLTAFAWVDVVIGEHSSIPEIQSMPSKVVMIALSADCTCGNASRSLRRGLSRPASRIHGDWRAFAACYLIVSSCLAFMRRRPRRAAFEKVSSVSAPSTCQLSFLSM